MLPENPQPPTAELITRRDCALRSALIFVACYTAGHVTEAILIYGFSSQSGSILSAIAQFELKILFVGTPVSAALGALIGFELYRLAVGSRAPRKIKWYIWVLVFLIVGLSIIGIFQQQQRRKSLLIEHHKPTLMAPLIYAFLACLVFTVLVALDNPTSSGLDSFIYRDAVPGSILTLLAADCLAVNAVARSMRQDRLAPPESHTFQFSLATLFYATLAFGAYATGLVMLFR